MKLFNIDVDSMINCNDYHIGELIGEGDRRLVYAHRYDHRIVVKVLKDPKDDHNKIEWSNWKYVENTDKSRWLAPCIAISDCGVYLYQLRGEPADSIPSNVPDWMSPINDCAEPIFKYQWVNLGGNLVLADYGFIRLDVN